MIVSNKNKMIAKTFMLISKEIKNLNITEKDHYIMIA
jgi:hypothetical protein